MTLLLMLLFKSLLVFGLSGLALLCLRRASASARHLVCFLTLAALLALPLFSLTLPGWQVAGLTAQEAEPTPVRPSPALPVRGGKELNPTSSHGPSPVFAATSSSVPSSSSSPARKTPAEQGGRFLVQGVFFFYFLGLLLASTRPLLGLWGIAHLRRACIPVVDTPTLRVSEGCAAALGLMRLPLLCRATVPVPLTWGGRRPVVALPLASADWPEDRLRSVLLHEMAHVKRRDWLSHRFADLTCALYWFHPLVWLLARRLRSESEIACDDLVLSAGIPAPEYARHLLEIAGALSRRLPAQSAIAMAQTPHIKRRILMVLDKTHSRRTVTRRALLIALVPSAAALLTLAALRPSVKAQAESAALRDATGGASVTTPDGMPLHFDASRLTVYNVSASGELKSVRFVQDMTLSGTSKRAIVSSPDFRINGTTLFAGITDADKPGGAWWSATGTLLPTPVYDTNAYRAESHAGPSTHNVSFAFRLPPSAADITICYDLPQSLGSSSDGFWPTKLAENTQRTEGQIFSKTNGTRVVTVAFLPTLTKTSLRVGIASGMWKSAAHYDPSSKVIGFGSQAGNFYFSPPTPTQNGFTLSLTSDTTTTQKKNSDLRLVAVDVRGRETLPVMIGDHSTEQAAHIQARFALPLARVKEILVETRPFQWIEFKNVALQPVQ